MIQLELYTIQYVFTFDDSTVAAVILELMIQL